MIFLWELLTMETMTHLAKRLCGGDNNDNNNKIKISNVVAEKGV